MDIQNILLLLAAGTLSGFLAGFFGVGGGIILVPILLWYFQLIGVSSLVATHLAFGTSLFTIIFASLSSAHQYQKNGQIIWKAVFVIGSVSVVGAWIGSWIAGDLQGKALQRIFAAVVAVAALRLLAEQRKPKGELTPRLGIPGLAGTGLVVGVVSSLAGVGGGVFSIPIMYSLLRFPLKRALGTSSATIVITATAAAIGYVVRGWGNPLLPPWTAGYVNVLHALPIIAATIPMAGVGARTAAKTNTATLRTIFAAFLLIVSAKMLFF